MTSRDFCYWLQGKIEIDGEPKPLSASQVDVIARHLKMVFVHDIDPKAGGIEEQKKLDEIHGDGVPFPVGTIARC
jgi:hypothetical protein